MHRRLAEAAVLVVACVAANGQTASNPLSKTSSDLSCPSSTPSDQEPEARISIIAVSFSGALQMPVADQDQIAESVKREIHGTSLKGLTDEALERVRIGWQNRGYFKVTVDGQARALPSNGTKQAIALFVHVDEGAQYTLRGISFENNRVIHNAKALRRLFPISDGGIFSREKIVEGLENFRKAYGQLGYINFVAVPDTRFDDEHRTASLLVDINEGKQFYVSNVDVVGIDAAAQQDMLKDFPAGQIYNSRLFDLFLKRHASVFPFSSDDPWHVKKRLDERAATVSITLDARPCPVD